MTFDVVVIGGGPAGMSAAVAAARSGARVALVDGGPRLGGQYYRQLPPELHARRPGALHHAWQDARRLFAEIDASDPIVHHPVTRAWRMERTESDGLRAWLTGPGAPPWLDAAAAILAPGAYERTLPFSGWDLPGVMTPGAAQTLVKGSQVLPGHRIVVAGTGPFLLAVASLLQLSGSTVVEVVEARRGQVRAWLRRPAALLAAASAGKLAEAAGYHRVLLRAGVRVRAGWRVVAARAGDDGALAEVDVAPVDRQWRERPGGRRTLRVDCLCVGYGFEPSIELAVGLGCRAIADPGDGTATVEVDADGHSSEPGVFVAGEATGVGGATLARIEGERAGVAAAAWARGSSPPRPSGHVARQRAGRRAARFAAALRAVHAIPDGWAHDLDDATTVCRCEEVTAASIRHAVRELGADDARSAKLVCRAGMGLCQGRMCAANVDALVRAEIGIRRSFRGGPTSRPMAEPVTVGELASSDG